MLNAQLLQHIENFHEPMNGHSDSLEDTDCLEHDKTGNDDHGQKSVPINPVNAEKHKCTIIEALLRLYRSFRNYIAAKIKLCAASNFPSYPLLFSVPCLYSRWCISRESFFVLDVPSILFICVILTAVWLRTQMAVNGVDPTLQSNEVKELMILQNRQKLSKLLGTVGAPLLDSFCHDEQQCETSVRQTKELLDILEQLTRAHVTLLLTVEEVMAVLRNGTSLRLGLGMMASNVERVEGTAISRTARKFKSNGSCVFPVTLPVLRARLYDVLEKQLRLLLETCNCYDANSRTESCVLAENEIRSERDEYILSLSLLRTKKGEVLNVLSDAVSIWSRCNKPLNQSSKQILRIATSSALETSEYLKSSLGWYSNDNNGMHSFGILQSVHNDLVLIQRDTDAIRVALLGCQEAYRDGTNKDECLKNFCEWWNELRKLSMSLEQLLAQTNEKLDSEIAPSERPVEASLNDGAQDESILEFLPSQKEEYAANVGSTDESCPRGTCDQPEQQGKVLVFSGCGDSKPMRISRHDQQLQISKKLPPRTAVWKNSTFSLIEELQQHILAMPSAEELEMNHTVDDVKASETAQKLESIQIAPIHPNVEAAALLVEDLKQSILGRRSQNNEGFMYG